MWARHVVQRIGDDRSTDPSTRSSLGRHSRHGCACERPVRNPTADELAARRELVARALDEDLGGTPGSTSPPRPSSECEPSDRCTLARLASLCGLQCRVRGLSRPRRCSRRGGGRRRSVVSPGDVLVRVDGDAAAVLSAERTALNLLQRLSGTATLTRSFVDAGVRNGACIFDTRKTLPGMRALQRWAVRCGGGHNHRFGLFDGP